MIQAKQRFHHAFKLIVATKTAKVCFVFGTHVFSVVTCLLKVPTEVNELKGFGDHFL